MKLCIVAVLSAAVLSASTVLLNCAAPIDYSVPPLPNKCGTTKCDSGAPPGDTGSGDDTGSDTGSDTDDPIDTGDEDTGTAVDSRVAPPDTGVKDTGIKTDTGVDPCNACASSKCGTEISACLADTMCKAQMDCMTKCPDSICADKCAKDFPSTKVDPMLSCVGSKCGTECGGP